MRVYIKIYRRSYEARFAWFSKHREFLVGHFEDVRYLYWSWTP